MTQVDLRATRRLEIGSGEKAFTIIVRMPTWQETLKEADDLEARISDRLDRIEGWENVADVTGEQVPYSRQALESVMTANPDYRNDILGWLRWMYTGQLPEGKTLGN